jgi:MYXO-CTERM domain-containing protein
VVGQDQVFAWDVNTGMPLWNIADDTSLRLEASPTLADGLAFLAGADGMVAAIDLPSGQRVWSRRVYTQGGLGYGLVATPSFADGRLIVPGSTGPLFALDVATGAELWHIDGEAGVVRPFMYRSDSAGFYGSAVVTGDLVWAGGVDGVIRAVDAATGAEVYDLDLGSPVLSGLVPGGDSLYVATYDGTVHALATVVPDAGPTPEAQGGGGCAVGGAPGGLAAWAVALALAQARRRRRSATRPRSASGPNAPGPPTEQPEP